MPQTGLRATSSSRLTRRNRSSHSNVGTTFHAIELDVLPPWGTLVTHVDAITTSFNRGLKVGPSLRFTGLFEPMFGERDRRLPGTSNLEARLPESDEESPARAWVN